jgi:hypothetical protein
LTGTQTIDSGTLVARDRILVNEITNASRNAINVVAAGPWTHDAYADSGILITNTRNPATGWQTRNGHHDPTPRTVERTRS